MTDESTPARQALAAAKQRLSRAAERCLRNEPGAGAEADQAAAEVDALLAQQRAHLCARHRPGGEWQVSDEPVRDEHRAGTDTPT